MEKLHEIWAQVDAEFKSYKQQLFQAVNNAGRTTRVERFIKACGEAMTKAFGKQEQLYSFAEELKIPQHRKLIGKSGRTT